MLALKPLYDWPPSITFAEKNSVIRRVGRKNAKYHCSKPATRITMIPNRFPDELIVLYLALIAFSGEFCRTGIRLQVVCYTENLAKRIGPRNLPSKHFSPLPA